VSAPFKKVKEQLLAEWPADFPVASSIDDLTCIFAGQRVADEQSLSDLKIKALKDDFITVHLLVRAPRIHTPPPSSPPEPPEPVQGGEEDLIDTNIHLHGCSVSEEEVVQLRQVFEKKKDHNGKMPFAKVEQFLRVYWKYMQRKSHIDRNTPFPSDMLLDCKQKAKCDDGVTLDQFLSVFFLFDNKAPHAACPHGHKDRVCQATREMHKALCPGTDFDSELFQSLFSAVDQDGDSVLTCQQVDLLYYLYSAKRILVSSP
jgi:hypothetical protein